MYRPPPRGRGRRCGRAHRGHSQPHNTRFLRQNPYPLQNPNLLQPPALGGYANHFPQLPPFQIPIPAFPDASSFENPAFPHPGPHPDPREAVEKAEAAVAKAHRDFLAAGEEFTSWKVAQSALMSLKVDSWASLGIRMQDVPNLRQLMSTEGKVDAFIHCFVGSRKITSLHDMDAAICAAEGIERFEELGLGPLLRHPLVKHYFLVSSDVSEVPKITIEDIVAGLHAFMRKASKAITAEKFLNFLAKKHSVLSKEMVGVHIRNLGFYITNIREAKREEISALQKALKSLKLDSDIGKQKAKLHSSLIVQEKSELDRRFGLICEHIDTFSSHWKNYNTHIRFDSSSSDDDDDVDDENGTDVTPRVSSCPYPSTTEEIARLGLNSERAKERSSGSAKRKNSEGTTSCRKKRKIKDPKDDATRMSLIEFIQNVENKKGDFKLPSHLKSLFELGDTELKDFITTWKYQCQEHSVIEVLNKMLSVYAGTLKRRKAERLCSMIEIFSSYPGIGLLNVSVESVKRGMIDTLYDTFESIGQNAGEVFEMIDVGPSTREHRISKRNITRNDIIEKLSAYVPNQSLCDDGDQPLGRTLSLLKILKDCEAWLALQFSVREFSFLGQGDFHEFLHKNISLLPRGIYSCLEGGIGQKSSLMVSMDQNQLKILLSQVENLKKESCGDNVSALLRKQFPSVNFYVVGSVPDKLLSDDSRADKVGDNSSSVFFSAALLCKCPIKDALTSFEPLTSEIAATTDVHFPQSSSEDAIRCLLKAPMLSDLLSWSHWDILYAPSLGPLLPWLLENIHHKDLSCMVTCGGKLIRIDPLATPTEFLDAAIQGSSFQTAVKLLSLVSVYGGVSHAPKSLLKQFAQRAIDVMIRNSASLKVEIPDGSELTKPFDKQDVVKRSSNDDLFFLEGTASGLNIEDGLQQSDKRLFSVASNFILDCLTHLPLEFCNFASEILVPALQSYTREAYSFILQECRQTSHRTMLHDIGLSLGIVDWIKDHDASCTDAGCNLMAPSETVKSLGSTSELTVAKCTPESSETRAICNSKTAGKFGTDSFMFDGHQNDPDCLLNDVRGAVSKTCYTCSDDISKNRDQDAVLLIESIRREEFGLVSGLGHHESSLLEKQHERLGRALHCLSQELYSQDSHLLLELIQNADDNSYSEDVDPTLIFILQNDGVIVLNNEQGFSAQNIRALCDIGNSTKRASAGYIGNKGIGFKSVFRVTDAPEIHSNGFHVKFDISEGQIGFVLPTIVPPCDASVYIRHLSLANEQGNSSAWKTCILLPFRPTLKEEAGMSSIAALFSDIHPSLLLFLHRLRSIQLRNMLNNKHVIMKRESLKDGIVRVSHGNATTSWLVVRKTVQGSVIRADVQSTEIAIAFTLQESINGAYKADPCQQPVFAFLPLRQYGLKFILQGDFVLPSSREEVDGDSAWNQWLLSEIPSLFVSAERSFCELACFRGSLGKAVSAFMSFVPLAGEVHGFFSSLPSMILSKLRTSRCLLLEGCDTEWFPPCRALRGWDEQGQTLLPDSLLQKHLGLGYLGRDIYLSDNLARALGLKSYGPKILIDVVSSICQVNGCLKNLGLDWLASFLVVLNSALSVHSIGNFSSAKRECDLIDSLKEIPIIPLSDGSYCSMAEGPVWLSSDSLGIEGNNDMKYFPCLYGRLRTIDPLLLTAEMSYICCKEERRVDNLRSMLQRIGVQQLSAHELIRTHILHHLTLEENDLMIEYLAFVMLHFQYGCTRCLIEKDVLISELQSKPIIFTNHGFKCPMTDPIHFSKTFGNVIDITKLLDCEDTSWHEVDTIYLKHSSTLSLTSPLKKWRDFLLCMGVTDFVQVASIEKNVPEMITSVSATNCLPIIKDWESPELLHLLSRISLEKELEKSKYLLEVLDKMWDDWYATRATGVVTHYPSGEKKIVESSFMKNICSIRWISSKIDQELHSSRDLYYDCHEVRSILGCFASYAVPKVDSKMLVTDIGFKTQVTLEDAVKTLNLWIASENVSMFSIVQMSNFYRFIWDGISTSKEISDQFRSRSYIFVPCIGKLNCKEPVQGSFSLPNELYWHDPTGCVDQTIERTVTRIDMPCRTLGIVYPGLHDFFVNMCGVREVPYFNDYMEILLQLSSISTPSQASHTVLKVFLRWADDIQAGAVKPEEVIQLKESLLKMENKILPTVLDKWVSLHPAFGLICWCDDEELRLQFKHSKNIDFLLLGDFNDKESVLPAKVALLMQKLGIPALSEVVSREAISYGIEDNGQKTSLVNWVLPFAQRYLFKLHQDRYHLLDKIVLERLNQLQILVVESLFYKYKLKGKSCTSKKRFESSCLLQGNILYIKRSSDSHTIFWELSRIFCDGIADLQLANFLHMITTMAESSSSEEQIDFFVVNSQKVPKLPIDEPVWSLPSLSALPKENSSSLIAPTPSTFTESVQRNAGKPIVGSNWPPTGWKDAPGFRSGLKHHFRMRLDAAPLSCSEDSNVVLVEEDIHFDQPHLPNDNPADTSSNNDSDMKIQQGDELAGACGASTSSAPLDISETLSIHPSNGEDAYRTGRLGEAAAYRYFVEKLGPSAVKWVNKELETGLPYDLLLGEDEETWEFVEVKSTKSVRKNWFPITPREWQFAMEKGDAFSIARVALVPPNTARVAILKNPTKLCQKNLLHLTVVMPKIGTAFTDI